VKGKMKKYSLSCGEGWGGVKKVKGEKSVSLRAIPLLWRGQGVVSIA